MPLTFSPATIRIGVIGLGYVGLPPAVEFGKKYRTIGFDTKRSRIDELNAGNDRTREVDPTDLRSLLCHPDEARNRSHRQFADMGSANIHTLGKPNHVLYDVEHLLPAQDSDARIWLVAGQGVSS